MSEGHFSIEDAVFEEVKDEPRDRVTYEVWTVANKGVKAQPAITDIYSWEEAHRLLHQLGGPTLFEVRRAQQPQTAKSWKTDWRGKTARAYVWVSAAVGGSLYFNQIFGIDSIGLALALSALATLILWNKLERASKMSNQLPPPDDARKPYTINHDLIRTTLERAHNEKMSAPSGSEKMQRSGRQLKEAVRFVLMMIGGMVFLLLIAGAIFGRGSDTDGNSNSSENQAQGNINGNASEPTVDPSAVICNREDLQTLVANSLTHQLISEYTSPEQSARRFNNLLTGGGAEDEDAVVTTIAAARIGFNNVQPMGASNATQTVCQADVTMDMSNPVLGQQIITLPTLAWTAHIGSGAQYYSSDASTVELDLRSLAWARSHALDNGHPAARVKPQASPSDRETDATVESAAREADAAARAADEAARAAEEAEQAANAPN